MQPLQLFNLFILFNAYEHVQAVINDCQTAQNCSQCITIKPECAWCQVLEYKSESKRYYKKCDLMKNHVSQGCKSIHNPKSSTVITADSKLEGDQRVSPKRVTVKLRPGQPTNVSIKIKTPNNFPVDLYFLMDLSQSMADDLKQISDLASTLSVEMKKVTTNFRLGFGGYVDKPIGPFAVTNPPEIRKHLQTFHNSQYTFGFKNYLPLTENHTAFQDIIQNKVQISFNVDAPEGSLEALMQVLACTNDIGWREKRNARRIVLLTTDQTFHYAGDGLLGGVVVPNDGACHLKGIDYVGWNKYDYPSLSQIRAKLIESQIVPILASLGNDKLYADVAKFFGENTGAVAERLASDSSNVVPIIKASYEKIARKVSISSSAPNGVDMNYATNCGEKDKPFTKGTSCGNVAIEQEVVFNATITANDCNLDKGKSKNFQIITDFDDIDVNLDMICNCPCEEVQEANSPLCTKRGTLSCGLCACDKGFAGRKCQCTEEEAKNITLCKKVGIKGDICSGRGVCECGECVCDPINRDPVTNIVEYIYGEQCECSNTTCGRSYGQICGGPDRGQCDCGQCVCKENWTGATCGESCPKATSACVGANGVTCSGKGKCMCNKCVCDAGYIGDQCQECIENCPNPCEDYKECAKCLAFDTSELTTDECNMECAKHNISTTFISVESIHRDQRCIGRDDDDCSIIFTTASKNQNKVGEMKTLAIRNERHCPAEADIMQILLGLIGAIVGIGLILIIIWRIITSLQDHQQVAKYNEETLNPKWDTMDNPIFMRATSTFENPTYGSDVHGDSNEGTSTFTGSDQPAKLTFTSSS